MLHACRVDTNDYFCRARVRTKDRFVNKCFFYILSQFSKLKSRPGPRLSAVYKVYWLLYTVGTAGAFLITPLYWIVAFMPGDTITFFNIFVHALNSVICVVEIVVSAKPWRWQHFYPCAIYGAG